MVHPSRHEIAKFADDAFEVDRDRILKAHVEKENRVLQQVKLTGNRGGYLPALIKSRAERERELALARVDAWARAFTLFGEPSDTQAEEALKTDVQISAAGSISAIRGELQLRSIRLRNAEEGQGMPWHLDFERSLDSALKEGVLRLRQQRIVSENSVGLLRVRSPAVNRASGVEAVASTKGLGVNSSSGVAEVAVTDLPQLTGSQSAAQERTSTMVTFNSRPVTVIRHPGTPEERRWDTRMGGDFAAKALFQASDKVVTGDEIHCDVFDQSRVILDIKPVFGSGEVVYWQAAIIPRSERNSVHAAYQPTRPPYPKPMYHATKPSVMVYSAQQQAELGSEWSENYKYQPYPRFKYHWTQKERIVQNLEEELALGGGWGDSPNDFAPY